MYTTTVDSNPKITVSNGKFSAEYSTNGTLMNPLEAFYASLAACAAVFTKKACKSLNIAPDGIEIDCKPFAGMGGALTLNKFKTTVHFPAHITTEQKTVILDSIQHCAVKEIVKAGNNIEFLVTEI
jgi:uncharacterized OsmC-like protein